MIILKKSTKIKNMKTKSLRELINSSLEKCYLGKKIKLFKYEITYKNKNPYILFKCNEQEWLDGHQINLLNEDYYFIKKITLSTYMDGMLSILLTIDDNGVLERVEIDDWEEGDINLDIIDHRKKVIKNILDD